MSVWKAMGKKEPGLQRIATDFVGAKYLLDMAMWLAVSIQGRLHLRLFKSNDKLDEECTTRMSRANRLMAEAWRELEWVRQAAEIEEGPVIREAPNAMKRILYARGLGRPQMTITKSKIDKGDSS